MSKLSQRIGSISMALAGLFATGSAFAQGTWDLDACVMAGGANCTSGGSTVAIQGWYANGGALAQGTLNSGGVAPGGWTGVNSKNASGVAESQNSPQHAIDNYAAEGASTEFVYLSFSKAVDLNSIAATWVYGGAGTGDFQLWRWNNSAATPGANLTGYNVGTLAASGWTSVTAQDFGSGLSKTFNDGPFFSSYWLVSTAIGGTNDAFKLGTLGAASVCGQGANQTGAATSGGACATTTQTNGVPEPATLAMVLMGVVGASVARRRTQAV